MIIVDSGLGGISVVRALRASDPERRLVYLADTAGFPYGKRSADDISTRAIRMVNQLEAYHPSSLVVLACNTLSTLCLDNLRKAFTVPFVGTVPAVKTAAQLSKTRRFTLLATPNTAHSRYSSKLIAQFGGSCVVDIYGAPNLAAMAENILLGEGTSPESMHKELLPAFHNDTRGKTDCIVLGCTHYPLIVSALKMASPWPVTFVDSGDAIARRALTFADNPPIHSVAYVTAEADVERYREVFAREGFDDVRLMKLP